MHSKSAYSASPISYTMDDIRIQNWILWTLQKIIVTIARYNWTTPSVGCKRRLRNKNKNTQNDILLTGPPDKNFWFRACTKAVKAHGARIKQTNKLIQEKCILDYVNAWQDIYKHTNNNNELIITITKPPKWRRASPLLEMEPRHGQIWYCCKQTKKDADQPAHPRSLISAFVIGYLESLVVKLVTCKVAIFL